MPTLTMTMSDAATMMSAVHEHCTRKTSIFAFLLLLFTSNALAAANSNSYTGGTPHSTVVPLTAETFDVAIKKDPANSLWLLKFYAPWCGHCKRLAPVLDEVAPRLKGKLAIGTIDCTIHKALCKEHGVRGYPTLKFARDGDIYDYPGTRKAESIVAFANKMSSHPVSLVTSYTQAIQEVAATSNNGVAFVAYHPNAEGDTLEEKVQSTHLLQVFAQVARKNQHDASFALLKPGSSLDGFSSNSEKPFVVQIEENVPPKVFEFQNEPYVTVQDMQEFVKTSNVATVSALGPQNFGKLGRNGKPLVIGVVDGSSQKDLIRKDLASFATTGPTEVTSKYYYGYMDGREWYRFLEQFNVTVEDLPVIMALDVPTRMYWKSPDYQTTKDLVMAIQDGKIEAQKAESKTGSGIFARVEHFILSNLPWSVIVIVLFLACIVMLLIPSPNDLRPPYDNNTAATASTTKKTTATKNESESAGGQPEESKKDK